MLNFKAVIFRYLKILSSEIKRTHFLGKRKILSFKKNKLSFENFGTQKRVLIQNFYGLIIFFYSNFFDSKYTHFSFESKEQYFRNIYITMSVETVRSEFLTWLSYNTSLSINPKNVYFQRINSENKSAQLIQWTFNNPNKRSLLFSYAQKEYKINLRKRRVDNDALVDWRGANIVNSANYISPKGPFPFANAANSITLSMNSATHTITQPRRWLDIMVSSLVSHEECKENYEYDYTTNWGGHYSRDLFKPWTAQVDQDVCVKKNCYNFQNQFFKSNNITSWPATGAGAGENQTVTMTEEIIVPPFDPFWPVDKSKMPDHFPWKDMSPVIPNVDRIEYSETFTNLNAGAFLCPFLCNTAGADTQYKIELDRTTPIVNATMILWWYEPPTNFSVPRSVDLPAWDVREYQKDIGTVRVTDAGTASTRQDTPLIQLKSMPSFIMVHARRNLDEASYDSASLYTADGAIAQGNPIVASNRSSVPYLAEITSINVLLGNRPNVINTNIAQNRLWKITKKNSKEIPSLEDWTGYRREQWNWATGSSVQVDAEAGDNAANGYLILTPEDLSEDLSPGVAFPTSLQLGVNLQTHSGYGGNFNYQADANDDIGFKLYVHVFYSKYFLRLTADSGGQFEEQLLNYDASRRLTEGASDSLNHLADGMSAQGSLQRLRNSLGTGGALSTGLDYRSRL